MNFGALILLCTIMFVSTSILSYVSHQNPSRSDLNRLIFDIISYSCLGLLIVFKTKTHYEKSKERFEAVIHWFAAVLFYLFKLIPNWYWLIACMGRWDGYSVFQGSFFIWSTYMFYFLPNFSMRTL